MSSQLTENQRAQIIAFSEEGWSVRRLSKKFKVSISTISRTINNFNERNSFSHFGNNGRPSKCSLSIITTIMKKNKENSMNSLRKTAISVEKELEIKVSHNTIRNYLNNSNIYACSPIKKPFLNANHIENRYKLSKKFLMMSNLDHKRIIFSDESKFNLKYSDGKCSVWRTPNSGLKNENLLPTFKHGGGGVMVWACFSYSGVGKLIFIDGIMDAPYYVYILSENLQESANMMGLNDYIFQQDNDPKHTSKTASDYFEDNDIELLDWPSQSPDLNPIENLWAIIKEKVAEKEPKNLIELKREILAAWNAIPKETLIKLAKSFKKRALLCYRAKGGHINY